MTGAGDGMPGGMCQQHATAGNITEHGITGRKRHVAAAASYYYIYMIQRGASGRFSAALNTGD